MDYKAIIKSFVVKTLLKLSGLRALAANIVFNVIWKKVIIPIINYLKTKKEVDEKAKKYEQVIKNPDSSADDIRGAFDDFNKS